MTKLNWGMIGGGEGIIGGAGTEGGADELRAYQSKHFVDGEEEDDDDTGV